ncbi:hypothetical protein Athai_08280 [Actinocatenispora thailandica]|uniref:GerMN domain-containing protein n=1 Tax=Actinocatenispora thailandica TaxID=227318 RepID=A0A7R7DKC3_9ACTN|nr:LpqB family beta-propeller domain-containing protein [Actinocatenispora thailandica]BCJ33325.1 hypothetical protein Athai_08280 [Actinocatenispora thailandica]
MSSRRRVRGGSLLGVVLAGLLGATLAGCGVPSSGPPVVVKPAPAGGGEDNEPQAPHQDPPPDPATASSPTDLVNQFYRAAGFDPNPDQLRGNVTQFFSADARGRWHQDPAGLTVVRIYTNTVTAQGKDKHGRPTATVRVRGELVGTLTENGSVDAPGSHASRDYAQEFRLAQWPTGTGGKEWLITNPPDHTLISTEAMTADYTATPVYFASPDHQSLVPDLRYVSKTIAPQKERTILVDWLLDGPSPWLAPAVVNDIPEGTKRRGNVVAQNDKDVVVVDLTSEAVGAKHLLTMAAQLAWTLHARASRLQLRVEGRPFPVPGIRDGGSTFDVGSLRTFNPATLAASSGGYYVSHGIVIPASSKQWLPGVLSAPATSGLNSDVQRAALNVDSSATALVRTDDDGRPALWIGHTIGDAKSSDARFVRAEGLGDAAEIGRPSLLPHSSTALVPVDGTLRVATGTGHTEKVAFAPGSPGGAVTAVAVSPDGCRVALVRGGHLYVAPLIQQDTTLSVGRMRAVASSFTDLSEVSWTQDDDVAFGGRGSVGWASGQSSAVRGGAWQFSLDDVSSDLLTGTSGDRVPEYVASGTTDPARGAAHGIILLAINGKLWQLTGNELAAPDGAAEPPTGTAPFFPN